MSKLDKTSGVPTRARQDDATLTADARQWYRELDPSVRPKGVATAFPRILNALSRQWSARELCAAYLDSLLFDARGSREGFPTHIWFELARLKDHYQTTVHPMPQTPWDRFVATTSRVPFQTVRLDAQSKIQAQRSDLQ